MIQRYVSWRQLSGRLRCPFQAYCKPGVMHSVSSACKQADQNVLRPTPLRLHHSPCHSVVPCCFQGKFGADLLANARNEGDGMEYACTNKELLFKHGNKAQPAAGSFCSLNELTLGKSNLLCMLQGILSCPKISSVPFTHLPRHNVNGCFWPLQCILQNAT